MIEVEVKAHASSLDEVAHVLTKIGAIKTNEEYQEDLYFNAPHRDFGETDEALRVRRVSDSSGDYTFITYKGAKLDEKSKTRKEVEVGVQDPLKAGDIFESLGFRPVTTVKKHRISYSYKEFIITLDQVMGVGDFVEIETDLQEGSDYQEALNGIFSLYKRLGIEEGFERRSYLELLGLQ